MIGGLIHNILLCSLPSLTILEMYSDHLYSSALDMAMTIIKNKYNNNNNNSNNNAHSDKLSSPQDSPL